MARIEADREDLFAELRSFPQRAEWRLRESGRLVTAGRKHDGSVAIYLGGDPVYRFDVAGGLRRAFVDGSLYRTQGGTLARLTRERTATETTLRRIDLTAAERDDWLARMSREIAAAATAIRAGACELLRCEPPTPDAAASILDRLAEVSAAPKLAPAIPTRRE